MRDTITGDKIIPTITHKLGSGWEQPSTKDIVINEKMAVMKQGTFNQLKNYSLSLPTGVYEGKMWRSEYYDKNLDKTFHYLHWWTHSEDPNKCKHEVRRISII